MSYKSLVVYANGMHGSTRTLNTAAALAARWSAHLTGVCIHEPLYYHYPMAYQVDLTPDLADDMGSAERRSQEDKAAFEKACQAYGVDNTDWRFSTGEILRTLNLNARYADLVLMPQADENAVNTEYVDRDLPAKLAIASGRPVIAVPYAGEFETVGQRILVAWDASREATRAVREALPLLHDAEQVTILSINPKSGDYKGHGEDPGADIALYLSRHDIKVDVAQIVSEINVADALLSRAADLGSDMICMGAYGHSRLRELALGGATRKIMQEMTVPVLFAH